MQTERNSIKNWAEDDRPREKLLVNGHRVLSDSELLAIILGSGSREESAIDLAKRILASVNQNWNELARLSVSDLCQFKGVGPAKAVSIVTALEIGRRRAAQSGVERPRIRSASDSVRIVQSMLGDLNVEEFWVLYLNQGNFIIHKEQMGIGGISSTAVDVRLIIRMALEKRATGMILSHNHPSGNTNPSQTDIRLTQKIKEAAQIFNIDVIDHIIVTQKEYFSFAEEGRL